MEDKSPAQGPTAHEPGQKKADSEIWAFGLKPQGPQQAPLLSVS